MKKGIIAIACGVFIISTTSCDSTSKTRANRDEGNRTSQTEVKSVTFKTADNYFINNTVEESIPTKITTQEEFEKYFGMAATMGNNGEPTPIDFSKEFVIVVDHSETTNTIEIKPLTLEKTGDNVVFNYKVTEGKDVGFTMRPFLMLIVSKNSDGNVILQKN